MLGVVKGERVGWREWKGWCDMKLEKRQEKTWRPSWVVRCDVRTGKCPYWWWVFTNWTYPCNQHPDEKTWMSPTPQGSMEDRAHCYSLVCLLQSNFMGLILGNFWFSQAVFFSFFKNHLTLPATHSIFFNEVS